MDIRQVSDDFFKIGEMAILYKTTFNDVYDFDFRNYFECKSVISGVDKPVLLHIGAVEDYSGVTALLDEMGMEPLVPEEEHLRCSTMEGWYPVLREKTPYTRIYDELPPVEELLNHFAFPVFVKGSRQTNRHRKSKCIIENLEAYEALRCEWKKDPVLSWQKVAVREYVQLQTIDAISFPDQVPISYEFRFFYFRGKCMGYGPYWYMGQRYSMQREDERQALELADWAADKLASVFVAIDVAKTAAGEWIVIEVNDAQESGFVGANSLVLWQNIVEAASRR